MKQARIGFAPRERGWVGAADREQQSNSLEGVWKLSLCFKLRPSFGMLHRGRRGVQMCVLINS